MEITITWTQIAVAFGAYLFFKYLRSCFQKWNYGTHAVFNPFVPFEATAISKQWQLGYKYGKKKMKLKHRRRMREFAERLKNINEQFHNLLKGADPTDGPGLN